MHQPGPHEEIRTLQVQGSTSLLEHTQNVADDPIGAEGAESGPVISQVPSSTAEAQISTEMLGDTQFTTSGTVEDSTEAGVQKSVDNTVDSAGAENNTTETQPIASTSHLSHSEARQPGSSHVPANQSETPSTLTGQLHPSQPADFQSELESSQASTIIFVPNLTIHVHATHLLVQGWNTYVLDKQKIDRLTASSLGSSMTHLHNQILTEEGNCQQVEEAIAELKECISQACRYLKDWPNPTPQAFGGLRTRIKRKAAWKTAQTIASG
ncbi:hypothetical protein TREMEDRAFT_64474 [Tremella mesenterica DSM 1558]|uniref:uncharacterized protein n=1 Tax=Tremella mesenterica (strain ATCC 24925 / CBS 8224 / DSM 1558 / NBRC 9311 / NRRL Y-6157 / RJB 2259-6 / UBC 559-6) TaxID=578456 RepID=UPI0003F4900C|nr:uncharacterized protein TREMEDRAFT_64474 [Tremella mesenterica DSM 1558]EIW67228.1 hypothetical protein TREMEDRAFT_64474 [Tremella mesenterica DSM 1558]